MKKKAGKRRTKRGALRCASKARRGTAEFDREFVADSFGPPSARARAKWERARRKPGRPRQGQGAKVISVSVERGLLARSDKLARELGISRAWLVACGLRAVLAEPRARAES